MLFEEIYENYFKDIFHFCISLDYCYMLLY